MKKLLIVEDHFPRRENEQESIFDTIFKGEKTGEPLVNELGLATNTEIVLVDNYEDAVERLDREEFDLVITDINFPSREGDSVTCSQGWLDFCKILVNFFFDDDLIRMIEHPQIEKQFGLCIAAKLAIEKKNFIVFTDDKEHAYPTYDLLVKIKLSEHILIGKKEKIEDWIKLIKKIQ